MTGTNPHEDDLFDKLGALLIRGVPPKEAEEALRAKEHLMYAGHPDVLNVRLEALATAIARYQEALNRVSYLQKSAIRFGREKWYVGPQADATFWNALKAGMKERRRTAAEIELVDNESTTVVSMLDNPAKAAFKTKGLVVGHVQSGKTGNIAGVITKAAETHYKFFLVMSGMTDQLRSQTQERIDRDVVGGHSARWMQWTGIDTAEASGEFRHSAQGGFSFDHRNQIAVVKKNKWILLKLLAKLRNTDRATLSATPFLIIDDECDQASVNSARYDHEMTEINRCIRDIVQTLPRVAYVGYTATPFANILIDTRIEDDLYPRDFIYALKRPSTYFGAEQLFGRQALEGEYVDDIGGVDVIRTVPATDAQALVPRPKSTPFNGPTVPQSLDAALCYFIMACAARTFRGQGGEHFSMLVHTSVRDTIHRGTEAALKPHLSKLVGRLKSKDANLLASMEKQWGEEQTKVPSGHYGLEPVAFASIAPYLADMAASIDVHVENWRSTERLKYGSTPRRFLVIGGNVLARGLTLEGLMVSYFLRSASQYDTLMQMGRWFGYRPGFEDLPRVWVEDNVKDMFYDLATVEAEIRREIARYADEEISPMDFAVRIRRIPGMMITSRAKMRHAKDVDIGFSGEHVQTFRFHRHDSEWLGGNWQSGSDLLTGIPAGSRLPGEPVAFSNVPGALVLGFLDKYQVHDSHRYLQSGLLASYIRNTLIDPNTKQPLPWTVVVVGGEAGISQKPLGPLGHVNTVRRSAEKGNGPGDPDASIKALMSRSDVLADLRTPDERAAGDRSWEALKTVRRDRQLSALLLLYPINAKSEPTANAAKDGAREALNAVGDVLGIGVVLPGEKGEVRGYVRANLAPEDPIEDLTGADEIPEVLFEAGSNNEEAT